jgi:hypothetical protein
MRWDTIIEAMSQSPSLEESRRVIRDLSLEWDRHVLAASVITSSRESSYDDLLACLRVRGLPAESAACSLYIRTRRHRADDRASSIVLDHDDWHGYLKEHGFMT